MVTAASLVPPLVNLFRPRWVLFRQVTRLIISAVCVGGLLYLLLAADWQGSANNATEVGRAAGALSRYMWYGVLLTAAGAAISLVWEAVSLWRRKTR
jgi:hypothetical protein